MRRDASDSKQPTDNISKNLVKWTHKQPYHSKDKVHLTSISGESSSVLYANMLHLTVDKNFLLEMEYLLWYMPSLIINTKYRLFKLTPEVQVYQAYQSLM